ncbi:MAG: hypothetical protein NTV88_01630 [Candidatus Micrarchaeota archaeon]|nr:hypothetical protein [Candidatus Micrarchaeota archaeon]
MVSLKKYIACKCGSNNSFSFDSDMNVEDISVSARCNSCGATVHISVSSLLSSPSLSQPSAPANPSPENPVVAAATEMSQNHMDAETKENVEQAVRDLFKY